MAGPARPQVLVVHGPNLNLLGFRDPSLYGPKSLEEVDKEIQNKAEQLGLVVKTFQSNHEGAILDFLHENRTWADGVVINPGGLTHTSIALMDALSALRLPIIEVHISNVHAREEFRRHSYVARIAQAQIAGLGTYGYLLALDGIKTILVEAM